MIINCSMLKNDNNRCKEYLLPYTWEQDSDPSTYHIFNNKLYLFNISDNLIEFDGISMRTICNLSVYSNHESIIYNNKLYFAGYDNDHGIEPWEYDGIINSRLLYDINPKIGSNMILWDTCGMSM